MKPANPLRISRGGFFCADKNSAEPKAIQRSFYLSQNQNFRELSLMPGPMVEDNTAERM